MFGGCLEGDGETDEGGDHGAAGLETIGDFVGLNEERDKTGKIVGTPRGR